jgi:hypothetical protein
MRPVIWFALCWLALLASGIVLALGSSSARSACQCALQTVPEPADWRATPPEPDGAGFFVDGPSQDTFHPLWIDTRLGVARLCSDETVPLGGWLSRDVRGRRAEDLSFRFVPDAGVWVVSAWDASWPRADRFVTAFRAERRPHLSVSIQVVVLLGAVVLAIVYLGWSLALAHARWLAARSMLKATRLGRDAYRSVEVSHAREHAAAERDAIRILPRALVAAGVVVTLACVVVAIAPA